MEKKKPSVMAAGGAGQLKEDVMDRNLCIGCGACVNLCPYFGNYRGRTVQLFDCDLAEGRCFAFCPKAGVDLECLSQAVHGRPYDGAALGHHREVVAARAGGRMPRGIFQGGGTVSALVASALRHGRAQAAVLTDRDGATPVARRVTHWREVVACATSKFAAAPTLAAVNRAVADGVARLAVVGTPCQVTAVAQMRTNPVGRPDFVDPFAFTVGLFCNWSLDLRGLERLLAGRPGAAQAVRMDIPPPPADSMIVETADDRLEVPLKEVKSLIPETCFICPDMTSELADVSVGMFEGRPGWNTLIIRTRAGAEVVAQAEDEGFLEIDPLPAERLEHLCLAAAEKKKRALRILQRRNLVGEDRGAGRAALYIAQEVIENIFR